MNLNHKKRVLAIILLLIVQATSFAQNRNVIDSLTNIINNKKAKDTTIIYAYLNLSSEFQDFNLDTALMYANHALKISLNIDYKKGIAKATWLKGLITYYLNNYKLADSLLNTAISVFREINDQYSIMKCYISLSGNANYGGENLLMIEYCKKALKIADENNIIKDKEKILINMGVAYKKMGDYQKAIECQLDALRISIELNNKEAILFSYINIGNLFHKIEEFDKALEYMNNALEMSVELKNSRKQIICLTNIGNIYHIQKKYDKALQNFNKSIELNKKYNNLYIISTNYNNIGNIYYETGKYKKALEYYKKSLGINEQIGNKDRIAGSYFNIAMVETELKNYKPAEEYCLKSSELNRQINDNNSLRRALEELANIYNLTGKYQKAYNTHVEAMAIKDSLFNIEKAEKIAQLEEKYLNEKKDKQIQELKYETEIQQIKIKNFKKSHITYTIVLILAIAAISVILVQFRKKNNAYKFLVKKNIDLLNKEKELKDIRKQKITNKPDNNKKTIVSDDKKEEILIKLTKLFDDEKIFKNFDLTIEKLAKELLTNNKYLSIVIKEEFGKNYIDFITEYRIKESVFLLSDPEKNFNLSINGIARESGFKSLTSFYQVFKKYTGITPSKFK